MKTVLTIAGSDCSGGAGIQADIKTITAHKLYAMSAVTALTAQNTTGVFAVTEVTPEFLEKQLDCIFNDIFPDAVKIGMLSSAALIEVTAASLKKYRPSHIVLDPVMLSTSGSRLLKEEAAEVLTKELMPLAELITPNIPEAAVLAAMSIESAVQMETAAEKMAESCRCAVLIKGGHAEHGANDVLYRNGGCRWYKGEKVQNSNTHGTGCTLSSAIAANLAAGFGVEESVARAKRYLTGTLKAGLNLGRGNGPLEHGYWLTIDEKE